MRGSFKFLAIVLVINSVSCSSNQSDVDKQKNAPLDTALAEIRNSRYLEFDSAFALFWNEFTMSIKTHDLKAIKQKSLDSLLICDTIVSTDTFLSKCYSEVFDGYLDSALSEKNRIQYYTYLPLNLEEISPFARNSIVKENGNLTFREIEILPSANVSKKIRVVFSFIKTSSSYIFYRHYVVTKRGAKKCCG